MMPVETTPESYPVETTPESEEVGTLDNVNERAPAFEGPPPVACLRFKSTSENHHHRYPTRASIQKFPRHVRPPYDHSIIATIVHRHHRHSQAIRAQKATLSNPSFSSYRRNGGSQCGPTEWSEMRKAHLLAEAGRTHSKAYRLAIAGRTHSMALRASTDTQRQQRRLSLFDYVHVG